MNKSLTEELHSVLLSHSLDAPEPAPTIDAVLSRTVSTATENNTAPTARTGALRNRFWRPSVRLVAVAASVAALVLGVAVINSGRSSNKASTSSAFSNSSGSAGSASGKTAGRSAGPAQGPSARPQLHPAVRCDADGSSLAVTGAPLRFSTASGRLLTVVTTRCKSADGSQQASEVDLLDGVSAARLGILVPLSRQLHIDFVYVTGDRIVVRAASWQLGPRGSNQGAVSEYPFEVSPDGSAFIARPATSYARSCTASQLRTELVAAPAVPPRTPGSTFLLRLTNRSPQPCAVEGYPDVIVERDGEAGAARQTLSGAAGGSQDGLAHVIVLNPGDPATALLEAESTSAAPRSCGPATGVTIELPSVGAIATVRGGQLPCVLQVHPLVPGISGSG